MKKMRSNRHYFKISQNNFEELLDDFYVFDDEHPELEKYIKNTKKIKNLLITIKILQDKKENEKIIDKYFYDLSQILGKFANCSEFACFINACDNTLQLVRKESELLKNITRRYFKRRILNEVAPAEWLQAILDTNSSRKKGSCGENKLLHILQKSGFTKVESWEDFLKKKKCVAKFSKIFSVKNVRKNLDIKLAAKKQGKKLDLIIKCGNKILLCEAKHLNTSGGGQDKQISELIEIISLKEKNKNIFYISFLDGNYSNIFLSDKGGGDKIKTQRKEIKKCLEKNPKNFWVNTAGFKALVSDL